MPLACSLRDDIMRMYNTVHIVVATPGRLLDLANKGVAKLSSAHTFVMDEVPLPPPVLADPRPVHLFRSLVHRYRLLIAASTVTANVTSALLLDQTSSVFPQADKLLSPEFQPVIEQLIAHVKPDRQIMLYSATFPVTVKQFKDKFLNKPYIVNLMEELTLRGITQVLSTPCTSPVVVCPVCPLYGVRSRFRFIMTLCLCRSPAVQCIVDSCVFSHAVLCICGGEAEGPLSQHPVLQGAALHLPPCTLSCLGSAFSMGWA